MSILKFEKHTTLSEYVLKKYNYQITKNPPLPKKEKLPSIKKSLIDKEVLEILKTASITDNILFLNNGMLDRKLYLKTNKIIESLGGLWNRNKKGHVFEEDPTFLINDVLKNGYYEDQDNFNYYPTPKEIVLKLIAYANLEKNHTILEPSAGQGHILDELKNYNISCGELLLKNKEILKSKGYDLLFEDFLKYNDKHFDRIIMNPPFKNQLDIDHVNHAYSLLNKNGRLVSIMSNGVTFRDNNKTKIFRELIKACGTLEELPQKSFFTSGTCVNTVIVILNKI